jgi:hypothetical protein
MPRESIIQILRSTGTDTPTGLTFGELAYSDVNEKLFVGDAAGNSIWVGAQVTAGSISTNSQYIIPTQSAVKTYVDGAIGGGSGVVNTVNATGGAITITGDGGAISNTQVGKANTIGARLATTSLTGVASFNSTYFSVANGAVSLVGAYQVTGDSVQAGQGINISANKTIGNIGVITFNGATGTILYTPPIASTSLTGVASFNSTRFSVSAAGAVDLAAAYQVTGQTVVSGGASQLVSTSGNTVTIDNRIATTSVTGVASFNSTRFSVSTAGAVDLAAAFQVTGDSVQAGQGINLSANKTIGNIGVITFNGATGTILYTQPLATTSVTGVASYNSTYFTVSSGAVSLATAYQATGDTVSAGQGINVRAVGREKIIGNIGVQSFNGATGTVLYTPPIASTSLTGVASFSSDNFAVSAQGVVTVKDGGIANAELVNSSITIKAGSGEAGQAISLGSSFSITGTANQVAVSRSTSEFTIGLPNDVTIPGNLTVNGTVVTANVDSFVVEDPLIMLGTGNAADSVDLGFYGQYTSSGKRFAGIYRDASDSGKFKFFTGLSGGAEPTTFVNDAGSGYTVATVVAKIDGGTF